MKKKFNPSAEDGFSLIELLVVILLLSIFATFAILGRSSTTIFAADSQAVAIIDVLQEARQKSLNIGRTLRVELNDTKKQIRLIDEKDTISAADDIILISRNFDASTTVGKKPANVDNVTGVTPPANSPMPEIQYTQTNYPLSLNDKVKTLRFLMSGEVVDGGTDNLGTSALNSGVTIYVYNGISGSKSSVVRAVTVSGVTGVSQIYKCQTNGQGICTTWVK